MMIGPAQPRQTCPDCEGEGFQHRGERQEFRLTHGSLFPNLGKWVSVPIWAVCDICGGSGKVTKKVLKELGYD